MNDRNLIADDGSKSARIVIIGEAGGAAEQAQLKPFVGPSGWRLNDWMSQAGVSRSQCYITNVVPYQPPGNKIDAVPKNELEDWVDKLHDRLAALTDPYVIVPTGNVALRALTGRERDTITQSRGFIQTYVDRNGRTSKVIPIIHPAATFRTPYWQRRCQLDWRRIATEAATKRLDLIQSEHLTKPSIADCYAYVEDVQKHRDIPLSVDIETPGARIGCVGFAQSAKFSFTIPTTLRYWGDQATLDEVWTIIKALCACDVPKVLQNGNYDAYWLAEKNVFLHNFQYETMGMHHALDAADDHNLAYMASIELRMLPWKHIPKDSDVSWRAAPSDQLLAAMSDSKIDALHVYNGIDNVVQWQLADIFEPRLRRVGLWDLYETHYVQMLKPLLSMMRHGIAIDDAARKRQYETLRTNIDGLQAELLAVTNGIDLRGAPNKKRIAAGKLRDLSSKKVAKWLYETMQVPKQVSRQTGSVTADEVAVRKAMLKYPKVVPACELILKHRRTKKLLEFLDVGALDPDGRVRSSYGFAPETGRLSSSKNPKGTGRNGQNVDRAIRGIFVPDEGHIFAELDLSQAEDRIVKVLSYCAAPRQELLDRARAMPWENDEHVRAAMSIFRIAVKDVTKDRRYIGKRSRHGANYGLGGKTLSESMSKDGYTYAPEECADFIAAVLDRDTPEVREWQKATRIEVLKRKRLVNDWGRVLSFEWDRMDDDTFRRSYAFIPQSSVPSILNQYGMIPLHTAIKREKWRAAINVNGHDSLLVSVHRDDAWQLYDFTRRSLERSRYYGDKKIELMIPTELKIGLNWAFEGGAEFKRPPSREEFEDAVARL